MKFEYKTLILPTVGFWGGKINEDDFEAKLNNMGASGWELVNSFPCTESNGTTRSVISVFKRIIE